MILRVLRIASVAVLAFCVGLAVYLQVDKHQFSSRLPAPPPADQHDHDTPPAEASHTGEEDSQTGVTDPKKPPEASWLHDDGAPHTHGDVDPWTALIFKEDEEAAADEEGEPYPPPRWYETTDPALYAEYNRVSLIKQFSDVPGIEELAEAIAVGTYKMMAEIPQTIDEALAHVRASNALFPDVDTQRTIEYLEEIKASGRPYKPTYGPIVKPVDEGARFKPILQPLIGEFGFVEAIRIFKRLDPEGAMEFKRILHQDPTRDPAETEALFSDDE